jgi:hypothetical protein
MLALEIFQFLCEDFVGVLPLVPLFRHYFVPRVELGEAISGGVTFRLRDRLTEAYILVDKKKSDEWRSSWCFARFPLWEDIFSPIRPPCPPNTLAGGIRRRTTRI